MDRGVQRLARFRKGGTQQSGSEAKSQVQVSVPDRQPADHRASEYQRSQQGHPQCMPIFQLDDRAGRGVTCSRRGQNPGQPGQRNLWESLKMAGEESAHFGFILPAQPKKIRVGPGRVTLTITMVAK